MFGCDLGGKSSALFGDTDASADMRILDSAWRGAEAYHFLMLAHRQLYTGTNLTHTYTYIHIHTYIYYTTHTYTIFGH